ncbi:MAG: low molecular weight phosphotyrosine protein phosphatase [Tannerella sp.]|jgi:protein-tyrosine phosphatase|nr:low molecular weight phosphotyrosine protein phosphatase [Tannerella sp.]
MEEVKEVKILFVCLGNICRSPAAEGILRKKVHEAGLDGRFEIDSAGTSGYHEGELPDPRMCRYAAARGYKLTSRSRSVVGCDFYRFDKIIGMDDSNIRFLTEMAPEIHLRRKICGMSVFCRNHHHVDHIPDPYYGGASGFVRVLDLLEDACDGIIEAFA